MAVAIHGVESVRQQEEYIRRAWQTDLKASLARSLALAGWALEGALIIAGTPLILAIVL
jgi:hypothetical protein